MKEFFRFSIREFLLLVICLSVCLTVNRSTTLGDFLVYYGEFCLASYSFFSRPRCS
jgi:hypothetical protein